jgi:hypothetical protein
MLSANFGIYFMKGLLNLIGSNTSLDVFLHVTRKNSPFTTKAYLKIVVPLFLNIFFNPAS